VYGAVLENAVSVPEVLEAVPAEDEDAGGAVLEVEDVVSQPEGNVAAA